MKLITFHTAVPMPCARIPVKLKFAKIQMADTPPSAAGEPDELISIDSARHVNTTDAAANAHRRRAHRSKQRCVRGDVNMSLTILTPGIGRDAAAALSSSDSSVRTRHDREETVDSGWD